MLPFIVSVQKAVIIGIAYPSADGAAQGCVPSPDGGCLDPEALSRPLPDVPSVALNTQLQADLYQAVFMAINDRHWMSGVTSRGYYPPAGTARTSRSQSMENRPLTTCGTGIPACLGYPVIGQPG